MYLSTPLVHGGSFNNEDAENNKTLVNTQLYPHLYGDRLFPELKCTSRSIILDTNLIRNSSIDGFDVNVAWAGDGKSPKINEIQKSIENFGFKWKYPPIAVFKTQSGQYVKINGRTRCYILIDQWKYTKVVVDVYEGKYDKFSEDKIAAAASKFGQAANLQGYDPHGTTDVEDLFRNCVYAIQMKWISRDKNGVPFENEVLQWIDDICGEHKLTSKPKESLVARIMNQYDEIVTGKRYWTDVKEVQQEIISGGHMNYKNVKPKYEDSNDEERCTSRGIIYKIYEISEKRRAVADATAVADANPDCEVRVIIYKQYVKAYDPKTNFENSLESFKDYWDNLLNMYGRVHFAGKVKVRSRGRCILYGAVASLKSLHDFDKLILLQSDGKWKQK